MQKYHHYTEVVDSLGLGKAIEEKPRIDVCLALVGHAEVYADWGDFHILFLCLG